MRTLSSIVLSAALIMCQLSATRAAAPPVTVGGSFALTAPDGTAVTDQTYRGKWLLVYFGYTSYPQRDTLEVIAEYTQSFDPRIIGLVGNSQQTAAVAKEYGAYYVRHNTGPGAEDYVIDHSSYLYLMDPSGQFVRAFDADTPGESIGDALHQLMARSRERESHSGLAGQMRR